MKEEKKMFCFQCQETAQGTGCTVKGVCGKLPGLSNDMDMLLATVRAVGSLADMLQCYSKAGAFITDTLFATITNANFDRASIRQRIRRGMALCAELERQAHAAGKVIPPYPEFSLNCCDIAQRDSCAADVGVMRYGSEDERSLKELVMYGLKGMAAYYEHAARLGCTDERIIAFMCGALALISNPDTEESVLLDLVIETGKTGVDVMALLDRANTAAYGSPGVTRVYTGVRCNPGILISGHDLYDMEDLLRQTEGTGIDVYTHCEMLPAHYYPKLKRYSHLAGNYGGAWWQQREDFEHFHGPIVFTTNCIVPPLAGAAYSGRVFTLNSTGYHGWRHIPADANGHKDFAEVIALARHCQPPEALENGEITGGYAHEQMSLLADRVVEAVRSGAVKRFVVMSGCDGRMKSRLYYTDFAEALPPDTIILTSGCAKYRYIKLPLGEINGIPRVLDAGQCNDSYSWVLVALKLKEMLGLEHVNDLPVTFNIAWYEQKAVIVLLALLSLGIRNIHLGPTLPAFLSPDTLRVLRDKFGLACITTVEEDMRNCGI